MIKETVEWAKSNMIDLIKRLNEHNYLGCEFYYKINAAQVLIYVELKDKTKSLILWANGYIEAYHKLLELSVLLKQLKVVNI